MTTASPAPVDLTDLAVGQELARTRHEITRDTLVRYAGASGDFNPIHYNDTVATEAGLPGVIAHGMLTMGTAITGLLDAIADPTAVRAYSTRFTQPIPVPATGSAILEVVAVVGALDEEKGTARVDLTAEVDGTKVLGRARATLALPVGAGRDGQGTA
ncbi:MaoC family dehydratase N-terminal domain-containing protein [Brachybacterium sp. Z12]|uniref:MaoC/PaaZ C-terminal domain-containing protein n=1 Tax=Brachybacterium sp. Z12 TaxID=2759167 RepID=UPI0018611E4F|nr:MaoC/PaaZ C-terminal domain-containing protein [Brachybacterium sp. Z12]QNN81874.1 MaoC family dehydratase N-terminal domain-containing protein [Brachybacterium sp. Z12]